MAGIFARNKLSYDITIRARFGTTVCALVKAGLGIAVIDQFTVAHGGYPGVELLRITEQTQFDTFIAVKRGAPVVAACGILHRMSALGNARGRTRADQPESRDRPPSQKITLCYVCAING